MKYSQLIFGHSLKPLRDIVYDSIKESILMGDIQQGQRLMETHIAEEIGVSRTPVREAIRKLELEGLVVMVPRRGAYVAEISLDEVIDVFEIRAALESLAAELASKRITENEMQKLKDILIKEEEQADNNNVSRFIELDTEFHEILFMASRNKRLSQIINNLREHIQRYRTISLAYKGRMSVALKEHQDIMDALENGKERDVGALARKHIESASNAFMSAVETYSSSGSKDYKKKDKLGDTRQQGKTEY